MTLPQIYALPVLGRYGLTHGLLSWARARLWCREHGATMLAPFWLKVRIGPYLRGERDKRNYFLLFRSGTAVSGLRRLVTLIRAGKADVGPEWPDLPSLSSKPIVLHFHNALKDNEKKSFAQVLGHGPFLREELLAMTRSAYHPAPPDKPFIAIHIRLGDFTKPKAEVGGSQVSTNMRLPIGWYGDRLDALRDALGEDISAVIFSDGSDEELGDLFARQGITRAAKQQSVTDLLAMGQGAALIASGSGFSLWGAFLGSVPRIAYPSQSIVPIALDATQDIESDFGAPIPASFVAHVRKRLDR